MGSAKPKVKAGKSKAGGASTFFEDPAPASRFKFDESRDDADTSSDDDVLEKDEVEQKLEKLLFGDEEGFQAGLKSHGGQQTMDLVMRSDGEGEDGDAVEEDKENLENVADDDLFFFDSGAAEGPGVLISQPETPHSDEDRDELDHTYEPAIWADSDDERMAVSLAGHQRLRKLRITESEDIVSGTDYIRRLRRQYVRLHPTPDWATQDPNKKRRKRASSLDSQESVSSGVDEMDTDGETELSVQPLAKLLQGASDLIRGSEDNKNGERPKLRQEVIGIERLKDVGGVQPSAIDSLTFHPHHPLLLSSGPASTLWLHHISPNAPSPNTLLTSLQLRKTPIYTSAFAPPTGNRIYAASRRRYYHVWDLDSGKIEKINAPADRKEEQKSMEKFRLSPCGRYVGFVGTGSTGGGMINVYDATTAQWIAQVRVDGRGGVADFAWWQDGNGMVVASTNGEVSEWDIRLRRVVARWTDAGAIGTTIIALGGQSGRPQLGGDRWVAIGSTSGIVNVYDRKPWQGVARDAEQSKKMDIQDAIPSNPTPVRALDQLVTGISSLVFAPDGQFMVMASRFKRDALRIVHLPSCTVYRNWPTSNTPLGRISSVAISPQSNYLAVANQQGKIRLWEIYG
ncbi:WD40-repeat-containing domain protein [Talaromyces proteolyticus]|uniref:WD40-repeat-containing domain protein n=1 Tax=Talaromyces proteolyticus TaxID=1131652 RepID=A0AAD4Q362_9EURO|nr:WD40-repeat-containing domain protein [Talaromyces proteolyticus]KAH8704739.1 WD40-repeat-containing domain protein [Talaromyces proteolyticus]